MCLGDWSASFCAEAHAGSTLVALSDVLACGWELLVRWRSMGATDGAAAAINALVVALNQAQTLLVAEQASIKTTYNELLTELGGTTDPQVVRVAQAAISAIQRLAEAAGYLRSAVDSATAFSDELGLPKLGAAQPGHGDTPLFPDGTRVHPHHDLPPACGQTHTATVANTHTEDVTASNRPRSVRDTEPFSCGTSIGNDLNGLTTGRQPTVRIVTSEDDLRALYNKWSRGGTDITPNGYDGMMVRLPDGTVVGWRKGSTSGGATIDIRFPGVTRPRKVHIGGPQD